MPLNMIKNNNNRAFTLFELLIVMAVIGILATISIFGLQGARQSARDATRKLDLQTIASGLELYKADCKSYPDTGGTPKDFITFGSSFTDATCSIPSGNVYIRETPDDPVAANLYMYTSNGGLTYELCAHLEGEDTTVTVTCGGSDNCGGTCNYKVMSP